MTMKLGLFAPVVRVRRQWLSRSWLDVLIVGFLPTIHFTAHLVWGVPSLLHAIPAAKRPGLYGACATVVSLAGTLASLTVAQYLSNRGDRVRELKKLHPKSLSSTWRGVFLGSVSSSIMFLTAYALDSRDAANEVGAWIFEYGAILALLRFLRLALLFGDLIQIIVLDDTDPATSTSIEFAGPFVSRENKGP